MGDPVTDSQRSQQMPEEAPYAPLTDHDYDGIQEYDNPLPGWWKWLFIASIVFTPPYMFWYHGGAEGRSLADQYDRELAANLRLQFAEIGNLTPTRDNVVKFLYQESWLQIGKAVFKSNCVSCHGKEGGGLVGPNLCDDNYKNVKDIGDILTVLQRGANAGAMPAWENRLSTNELVLVASYVASLRGSEPAVAKPAEGNVIGPWPPQPEETTESESTESESTESESKESESTESDVDDTDETEAASDQDAAGSSGEPAE